MSRAHNVGVVQARAGELAGITHEAICTLATRLRCNGIILTLPMAGADKPIAHGACRLATRAHEAIVAVTGRLGLTTGRLQTGTMPTADRAVLGIDVAPVLTHIAKEAFVAVALATLTARAMSRAHVALLVGRAVKETVFAAMSLITGAFSDFTDLFVLSDVACAVARARTALNQARALTLTGIA